MLKSQTLLNVLNEILVSKASILYVSAKKNKFDPYSSSLKFYLLISSFFSCPCIYGQCPTTAKYNLVRILKSVYIKLAYSVFLPEFFIRATGLSVNFYHYKGTITSFL